MYYSTKNGRLDFPSSRAHDFAINEYIQLPLCTTSDLKKSWSEDRRVSTGLSFRPRVLGRLWYQTRAVSMCDLQLLSGFDWYGQLFTVDQ